MFLCLWFFVPLGNFSFIWRRYVCRWRAANFDQCSALMAIEQWGFFSHAYCDTDHPFIMVISEDPWHSHVLLSVWQWNCHYLFLRHISIATGIRTPNLPLARRTLLPTAPQPRCPEVLWWIKRAVKDISYCIPYKMRIFQPYGPRFN